MEFFLSALDVEPALAGTMQTSGRKEPPSIFNMCMTNQACVTI